MAPRTFSEVLHDGFELTYATDQVLYEDRSDHQHLVLFDNATFGKVLMLDGITQVTTADEFIYHEMMAHVPLFAHGAARHVAIVGGGDCGMAEEVLKHGCVETLTQIEIDESVVDFSKEHFSTFNSAVFEDDRFHLKIADGAKFFTQTDQRFDVVLVDSTDPVGPGEVLFSQDFYASVYNCLKPGGLLVTQNGVPFLQRQELVTSIARFSRIFAEASAYIAAIPTYVGGHMAFGWATDNPGLKSVPLDVLTKRFEAADIKTRYYTPAVHKASFALPRFIEEAVEEGRAAA